jgi:NAD(P)H-dependent FMN reductase
VTRIVGISGSLRERSFNTALLRAAAELAPPGTELEVRTIAGIPIYNADVQEAEGFPAEVRALKDAIAGADGLLLASPEYNWSVPGPLKNAIDWASRPASDIPEVFAGCPVGLVGAGGLSGTRFAQSAWLPVFRTLQMLPWFGGMLFVERAWEAFDDERGLTDEKSRERLAKYITGFAEFVEAHPRAE